MVRKVVVAAIVLGAAGFGLFWFVTAPSSVPAAGLPAYAANIDNGRTMFFAGGCASCHATPAQDDKLRLGGGLALRSPFGTFHAPNISSDPNDGIGGWTEAQFVTAMTKGASPAGTHYYPAFPYASYQRMRLEDIRDLFAFMKTLPAVAGSAPGHDVPFPFNIRRGLGAWKLLYAGNETWRPDPAQSDKWNRGAYLVNGPAHCAECHSPRNLIGGIDAERRFAGGPSLEGEGSVPDITQKGLGDWSEGDIAYFLETGATPLGDYAGGAMAPVIANIAQLSAEDRAAMAHYLKSLPTVDSLPRPGGS